MLPFIFVPGQPCTLPKKTLFDESILLFDPAGFELPFEHDNISIVVVRKIVVRVELGHAWQLIIQHNDQYQPLFTDNALKKSPYLPTDLISHLGYPIILCPGQRLYLDADISPSDVLTVVANDNRSNPRTIKIH